MISLEIIEFMKIIGKNQNPAISIKKIGFFISEDL